MTLSSPLLRLSDDVLHLLWDEWLWQRGWGLGVSCRRCWQLWGGRHLSRRGVLPPSSSRRDGDDGTQSLEWRPDTTRPPRIGLAAWVGAGGLKRLDLRFTGYEAPMDLDAGLCALHSLEFFRLVFTDPHATVSYVNDTLDSLRGCPLQTLDLDLRGARFADPAPILYALGLALGRRPSWRLRRLSLCLRPFGLPSPPAANALVEWGTAIREWLGTTLEELRLVGMDDDSVSLVLRGLLPLPVLRRLEVVVVDSGGGVVPPAMTEALATALTGVHTVWLTMPVWSHWGALLLGILAVFCRRGDGEPPPPPTTLQSLRVRLQRPKQPHHDDPLLDAVVHDLTVQLQNEMAPRGGSATIQFVS